MYFFQIGSHDMLDTACKWFEEQSMYLMASSYSIPIGQDHVMDMDKVEQTWMTYGYLLFHHCSEEETTYYILISTQHNIPPSWNEVDATDSLKSFFFLFEKRLLQRLRTRKIIKEYKREAKRRAADVTNECEEEILLSMLERIMTMKKGEELYWFRDYEQTLLEAAMKEMQHAIEYKFRPGNVGFRKASESFSESIQDIVNKQHC